jgi:hypothetical protein
MSDPPSLKRATLTDFVSPDAKTDLKCGAVIQCPEQFFYISYDVGSSVTVHKSNILKVKEVRTTDSTNLISVVMLDEVELIDVQDVYAKMKKMSLETNMTYYGHLIRMIPKKLFYDFM